MARRIDDTVFGLIDLYVFHTLRFFVTYTPVAVMLFILSGASLVLPGPSGVVVGTGAVLLVLVACALDSSWRLWSCWWPLLCRCR